MEKNFQEKFATPRNSLNSIDSEDARTIDAMSYSSWFSDIPSNIIIKSRIKYGNGWSLCKGIWLDYTHRTTLHGFRYIFSVHRPFYERFAWFILTLLSNIIAVYFIWFTFLKWQDSPVILGFDETLVPIHKIPFPTVTICPEIKFNQTSYSFGNISKRIWHEYQQNKEFQISNNLTEEEINYFAATLHICETEVVRLFEQFIPENLNLDITETLVDLSISKNETAPFCKWNNRFYFCHLIYNYVPTDEGICYQFNGMEPKDIYRNLSYLSYYDTQIIDFNNYYDDGQERYENLTGSWSLENGYIQQGFSSYPQRSILPSTRNGFFSILQGYKRNFEYDCRSYKQGYKIFLNSPENVPLTTGNYILVPHENEVMVSVLPEYIIGDKSLHEFSPEKRQCYFSNERYLRYFLHYSQTNCQTECLVNYTISKCGCAKFWMPKPSDIRVCAVKDIICYTKARDELNAQLQNQSMVKSFNPKAKIMCDCMPACTSLGYNHEISTAFYDMFATIMAHRLSIEEPDALGSRLAIYFKEYQFTAIKRTVLYSVSTLVAKFGGILGLFMGFSTLSVIEVCYFFTVRLVQNLRLRKRTMEKLKEKGDHYY